MHINRDISRVTRYIAAGKITTNEKGEIDVEKADDALTRRILGMTDCKKKNSKKGAVKKASNRKKRSNGKSDTVQNETVLDITTIDFNDARAIEKTYQAKAAEMAYRKIVGEVVLKKDVEAAAHTLARKIRDQLLNIPDRVASVINAEIKTDNVHRVHKILMTEISSALKGLKQ